jgi:putative ABC transport system permease protein
MAWREIRASWRRLIFFFLCLSLGVGAIVTLRSVVGAVHTTLTREARALLGADVAISTNRPWDPKVRAAIDARVAQSRVIARSEEVEALSMVRPADARKATARLVELKGVQPAFPLYGELRLESGEPYAHGLLANRGVLVRPELLAQLDVAVGDDVIIGRMRFTIRGVVTAEPGRSAGGFSFGSRLFLDLADLERTGLLGVGSRANYALQLKVPEAAVGPLARDLRDRARGQFVRVRTFQATENDIGRELERTENYLSLVGLVIVALGGIGVWSVVRVYLQQKLKTVAVLKCLGATGAQILATYVAQIVGLSLVGSAFGVGLAKLAIVGIQPTLVKATGVDAVVSLSPSAVAQGVGVGLLVALLFALVPLLEVRHVRAALLLRESAAARAARDWISYLATAVVVAGLLALAAWQAGSWRVGAILSGGFAGMALLLLCAALMLVKAMAPLRHSRWFTLRYAARRIGRPGSQAKPVLLAVGLGVFLVLGVQLLQENLFAQFQVTARPDMPDMFLIDVQPDQVQDVTAFLKRPASGLQSASPLIPVLRARVTGVKGRDVALDTYEDVRGRGSLGREYVITYRAALERNERVVDGAFWPATSSSVPEVSIERSLRERQRLAVGDLVRFDVLGRSIEARVTSVRSVEWSDARAGGFMFVFRPGPLDAAPQTFIAPVKGPPDPTARARFQRDLTAQFPNVSVVDVQEMLAILTQVLGTITLAVSIVGMLVLTSGILILVGAISMTKFQRVYEAAILKTIGATTRHIATMLAIEYGLLGLLAGIIGAAGAVGLSCAVSAWAFDVPWRLVVWVPAAGVLASVGLVSGVGILASLDVLRRRPLAALRAE